MSKSLSDSLVSVSDSEFDSKYLNMSIATKSVSVSRNSPLPSIFTLKVEVFSSSSEHCEEYEILGFDYCIILEIDHPIKRYVSNSSSC